MCIYIYLRYHEQSRCFRAARKRLRASRKPAAVDTGSAERQAADIHTYNTYIQYIHTLHTHNTYIQHTHTYNTYIHTIHTYNTYNTYIRTIHTYIQYIHTYTGRSADARLLELLKGRRD